MRTTEKQMTPQELEALNMLKANYEAWSVFVGYFKRRFEYEKDKLVNTTPEYFMIQQGIAKAYREVSLIEEKAEEIYKAYETDRKNK
jgi:hypothetical protein